MPALSLARWAKFEETFGPLTIQERIDAAITRISYVIHASAGGKEPPEHFEVRWVRPRKWTDENWLAFLDAAAN